MKFESAEGRLTDELFLFCLFFVEMYDLWRKGRYITGNSSNISCGLFELVLIVQKFKVP